jgi:glucose-1-phosphate adenylyltransferase
MQKQIIGMVLAGGRVDELLVLTAARPKSAVAVWGMYRVIDFVLSNMMHAGIEVVGVLSQYRPYSLMTHLATGEPWDYVGRARALRILSPFKGADESDWYKGTADALYQNLGFIDRYSPDLVLVAAGDHVYSMDYRPLIRQHLATRADLTIVFKRVPRSQAHRYGTAVLDDAGRVVTYQEKVRNPAGDLASLTVYVFNARVLADRLRQNAQQGTSYHIYSEIIPRMVEEKARVFGWVFDGYWQYARTLDDYYATNMDILGDSPPDLAGWRVRTNLASLSMGDHPPVLLQRGASARASLICDGAMVDGTIERSILSPGVVVERGAAVRNSVILHGCRIGAGAVLDRVILDKQVRVGAGAQLGTGDLVSNTRYPEILSCGVTVIGKGSLIPAGMRIGRGCVVSPNMQEADFSTPEIPSGTTVTL